MKIAWAVPFKFIGGNAAGYTGSSINLRKALQEIGVEITDSAKTVIHYCHPADCFPIHGKNNILWTMYESNPVPPIFAHRFKQVDAILTPSEFCYDLFKPYVGKKPLLVSKLGFDPNIYTYKNRIWRPGKDTFIWGWNAAPNPRKGYGPAMAVWARKFQNISWMHMIFKTTSETGEGQVIHQGNVTFDSRMYSSEELVNFYHGLHGFLYPTGGEGFGLCLDPDTWIQTPKGGVKLSNININDEVLSSDGLFHKVLNKVSRTALTLKVKCLGSPSIICSYEHPFFCIKRNQRGSIGKQEAKKQNPEWVKADQLNKGDYVGFPIPKWNKQLPEKIDILEFINDDALLFNDNFIWYKNAYRHDGLNISEKAIQEEFNCTKHVAELALRYARGLKHNLAKSNDIRPNTKSRIISEVLKSRLISQPNNIKVNRFVLLSEEFLELLGWYLAEGSLCKTTVDIALHKTELDIAEKLSKFVLKTFNANSKIRKSSTNGIKLTISSKILSLLLKKLCGKGAHNKTIHSLLWNSSTSLGMLIRGLFYGDGCYSADGWSLATVSSSLAWQVRNILLANNILALVSRNKQKYTYKGVTKYTNVWTINISRQSLLLFETFIHDEPKYRSGYDHSFILNNFMFVPIQKIEQGENINLMDIEVEDSHSFVGNGILLHNTSLEALATGLPVISTRYGGQMSYLSNDSSWFCDHNFEKVPMTNGDTFINASADYNDLGRKMLDIMEDYPAALERAKRGAERIHSKWTWHNAARQLVKNIERLGFDS